MVLAFTLIPHCPMGAWRLRGLWWVVLRLPGRWVLCAYDSLRGRLRLRGLMMHVQFHVTFE